VRDVQIRLLLGETRHPSEGEIAREAQEAAAHFFMIYGM
jgi:hypothetical protein